MLELQAQVLISKDKKAFLDERKVKLLYKIHEHGSIRIAAQELQVSYQLAWTLVDELNQLVSEPLVLKKRGGSNGGGAELSASALRILKEYQQIKNRVDEFVERMNIEMNL